jgi:hypothetical protein
VPKSRAQLDGHAREILHHLIERLERKRLLCRRTASGGPELVVDVAGLNLLHFKTPAPSSSRLTSFSAKRSLERVPITQNHPVSRARARRGHPRLASSKKDVGGRDKPGHDDREIVRQPHRNRL